MKQLITTLLGLSLILSLTGCIEEKNEYFVNADGSGKVIHEVFSVEGGGLNMSPDAEEPDADTQLKELAQEKLQNTKGIDTWADVTTEVSDDGKLHFKGTAYFKDVTKVSFDQENVSSSTGFIISRDDKGLLVLEMKTDEEEKAPTPPTGLTAEQITRQIKQQRLKYNQSKPLMESILSNLKQTTIVHFNGRINEAVNVVKGDNIVSLTFEGKKLMEYMDSVMADDKKIEQMIRTGKSMQDADFEGYFEYVGGRHEKPHAVIELTGTLFNYDKEVATAKAKYSAMVQSLNLPKAATVETKTVKYTPGMDVQNLRVGGVRIIYFEDKSIDYRPFYQFPGYELSLLGKLPATDLQINEGKLTKAVTLAGTDLLPEQEFDRSLNFLNLAQDGVSVSFNTKMQVPNEAEKGMAEVAGILKCFKSKGIKTVDLGLMELKEGAKNEDEGVSINKAGKAEWGDSYEIELKLKVLQHILKDIQLFDENGTQIEARVSGGMSSNGFWLQRGIQTDDPLPAKGRIVLQLYDGLEEYEIPFSIKNIALTGKPL